MSVLMPETRTWEKQGVTIEYLCFETMFSHKVMKALRDAYLYDAPTPDDPDRKEIPTSVYMFYKAMPLIASVRLVDDAPLWGQMLKTAIEDTQWLSDPVSDYVRFERRAPDNLLMDCYDGYKATRETAFVAPLILQTGEPQEPTANTETGEVDQNALNFTDSGMTNGGKPLTIMPSRKSSKPSGSNRQTTTKTKSPAI